MTFTQLLLGSRKTNHCALKDPKVILTEKSQSDQRVAATA
jgi:hypothetical protein